MDFEKLEENNKKLVNPQHMAYRIEKMYDAQQMLDFT